LKYKKTFLLAVTLSLFIVIGCTSAEARLVPAGVQNDRAAVVAEAYYAVYGSPLSCAYVPNWNYLANTAGTYWHTRDTTVGWLGRYPLNGWMTNANDATMRQYFVSGNLPAYGRYGGIARGGQCKYFANYLLYNAGISGTDPMPSYLDMAGASRSSKYARAGDVLFKTNYHTAIVVQVSKGSSSAGTVTSVQVVDSNYVGGTGNERIALHSISGAELAGYSVWTGVPYYYCY